MRDLQYRLRRGAQSGSMFLALFGAVAMLGVVGAGLNMVMKGPVSTIADVNRRTLAENNMVASAKLAIVMAPKAQASNGDCDGDGYVEPLPYRDAGAGPKPAGGGYIPAALGAKMSDPWNMQFGYCVWDIGSLTTTDNVAACGGSSAKRLKGGPNNGQYAVAIISAGKDKVFQTACNAYADVNADKLPDTALIDTPAASDDMVMGYTYAEATNIGGDALWALKTGEPDTATIGKNLDVSGGATLGGALKLGGGLVLPGDPGNNSITGPCNAANDQEIRRNTSQNPPTLEICNFAGGSNVWQRLNASDIPIPKPGAACNSPGAYAMGQLCVNDYGENISCTSTAIDPNTGSPHARDPVGNYALVCNGTTNTWKILFEYDAGSAQAMVPEMPLIPLGVANKDYVDKTLADFGLPSCGLNEWAVKADFGYTCFCGNPGPAGWTERTSAGQRIWFDAASSADGIELVAVANPGFIYTSRDSGATWREQTEAGSRNWAGVAMSSDGTKLAATADTGYIYTSADGGLTWTAQTNAGSRVWTRIAMSADGMKLVAGVNNGFIYTSADSGVTWTQRTASGSLAWRGVTISDDGTKIAAVAFSTRGVFTSTDSGATWTERMGAGSMGRHGIAGSSDGMKLFTKGTGNYLHTSTDGGATWTQRTASGALGWSYTASSTDGVKLAAFVINGVIKTSADSGATWTTETGAGSRDWTAIASSADGSKVIAVARNGYIYTLSSPCNLASCTAPWGGSVAHGTGTAAFLSSGVPYGDICTNETRLCSNGALGGSMENASCAGGFSQISTGDDHACGLTSAGTAWCWGKNDVGQLGDGTNINKTIPTMINGHVFTQISTNYATNCALKSDGSAWCWGSNIYGQIGDGTKINRNTPTIVTGGHVFTSIRAGSFHTCGLKSDGSAWCWGRNDLGQVGNGTISPLNTPITIPTAVTGGHVFSQLRAGHGQNCGLKSNGSAWCWGYNLYGELGDGTTVNKNVPTAVTGGHVFKSLSAGRFQHTCGIRADDATLCWGLNGNGQLGDNTTVNKSVPTVVGGGHVFTRVEVGTFSTCAIKNTGAAWCWGRNDYGQLGDGTTVQKTLPTAVTGGHFFTQIFPQVYNNCAAKSSGETFCWGYNNSGQTGDNTTVDKLVPTPIYQP